MGQFGFESSNRDDLKLKEIDDMSQIYFIAGASGSGKTAVAPYLKKILPEHFQICDFDDIGVPHNADKKWRQESTEKWLQKLLKDNKDTCLLGQMVLGEILACPSSKQFGKINLMFLDVSDSERVARLKYSSPALANQNMLNWASWLRMHHADPSWTTSVIEEDASSIMNFSQLKRFNKYNEVANLRFVDTSGLELSEVALKISEWINNKNLKLEINAENSYHTGDKKIDEILEILKAREPIFHHPEILGKTKKDIENQMTHEFWEVGASGNIYSKQDVIEALSERYHDKNYQDIWETSDFKLTQIAKNAYLLTYHLIQNNVRHTRRSTIWIHEEGQWRIFYHQGTVIE